MQWLFKNGLVVLLVQAVNAFSAPPACWQSSTTEAPPDGRLCIAFSDPLPTTSERVFYGRSALNLDPVSSASIKHFCAFEAASNVYRADTYYWLHGKEKKVRAAIQNKPIVINAASSPDQSEKRKLKLGNFIRLFERCDPQDKPTDQQQAHIDAAKTPLCIKSTDKKTLDFGKFSRTEKCEIFDATLSDKKPSLPLDQLAEIARQLKERPQLWVHSAWAKRRGEPFASHSAYGSGYKVEYCVLQAYIRGHRYCSVDDKGRYQTGESKNDQDQYKGRNDAYKLLFRAQQPDSDSETTSQAGNDGIVDDTQGHQDL